MRKAHASQLRLDASPVLEVQLNLNCRDEVIPVLRALQHVYSQPQIRDEILRLINQDVRWLSECSVPKNENELSDAGSYLTKLVTFPVDHAL